MTITRDSRARVVLGATVLAAVIAACGTGAPVGSTPTPTPTVPVNSPTPAPTDEPTASPTRGQPTASPTPVAEPSDQPIVRLRVPSFARATADRVNVRTLPGLEHPLVNGNDTVNRRPVKDIQLSAGQEVTVALGPVVRDGYSWYQVIDTDGDAIIWGSGWVAGEFLRFDRDIAAGHGTILAFDAIGVNSRFSAPVRANSDLYYTVMAVPLDGMASCEASVAFVSTDGASHPGISLIVTKPTVLWQSRVENGALYQAAAGEVTFSVISNCSYAAAVTAVTAG